MRFYKDPKKIYLDSAKAGPMYYELLDWRIKYERKSLVEKSQIRNNHENLVKEVEKKPKYKDGKNINLKIMEKENYIETLEKLFTDLKEKKFISAPSALL